MIREFLIILSGIGLFLCLIYLIGLMESRYLKKRRKIHKAEKESWKLKVILLYLVILCVGISLCFYMINYKIRGAA